MTLKIAFSTPKFDKSAIVAFGVQEGRALTALGKAADKALNSLLSRTMEDSRFEGKVGQVTFISTPADSAHNRIVLFGLGKPKDLKTLPARKIGAAIAKNLDGAGIKEADIVIETSKGTALEEGELAAEIAFGAMLKSYRFDKYFTQKKPEEKQALVKLNLHVESAKQAKKQFETIEALASGIFLTRDLVSEPANVIHPESLAERCKELAALGVDVELLGEKQMAKLGMNALLGVGQGSSKESHLVIMRWNGSAKQSDAPLAIIGKGVTFDTGGISIKPAANMEDMKFDMGGAGTVIGLMHALASRKAKANVIGVVGLVENMPSGTAQRPGDVVKAMSGTTIEIINTDAEGRLVLADALWYTQSRFKPKAMIDLATLTGAIIVSLGKSRAGLFSNNDKLAKQLAEAGETEGERLWRLPVGEEYESHIKSDIADIKNVGKPGQAGSISAAEFLARFVNDIPWAHLDIAGVAWAHEEQDLARKGATAFGIRLLNRFIEEHYESKK